MDENGPDVRVPGFGDMTPAHKYEIKKQIAAHFGPSLAKKGRLRMGYLVKRGAGDTFLFSRKTLKLRWFVIKDNKLIYYRNFKAYKFYPNAPLKDPVTLKGRAVRVVHRDSFCFEISGVQVSKRAYLLFARDFTDFILWLHALMWAADKHLDEIM